MTTTSSPRDPLTPPPVPGKVPAMRTCFSSLAPSFCTTLLGLSLALAFPATPPALAADASTTAAATTPSLVVFPKSMTLKTRHDVRSFVAQLKLPDQTTLDVTDKIQIAIAAPKVRVDQGIITPLEDGQTELTITHAGHTVTLPITVEAATTDRTRTFRHDVMPVFMKAGCNTGSCHGAARGKDGFMLSLFGYDPVGDHQRITQEQLGRRVNLEVPDASLLVEKAIGAVPHTGGKRFEKESAMNQALVQWIADGVPSDPANVPSCTGIEVYPAGAVLRGENQSQKLSVLASYSDGSQRDVTGLAVFLSSNDHAVAVSEQGLATSRHQGEAFVMARFDEHTVGIPMIVIPAEDPLLDRARFTLAEAPGSRAIDQAVNNKLMSLRIEPSELCTDEEFLRRVYIDLIGLLPTSGEYEAFLSDRSPDKRARLIDKLIQRPEFNDLWVSQWAEWLMIRSSNQVSTKSVLLYHQWLKEKLISGVPVDEIVYELLTSEGGTFSRPEANFYEIERDTLKVSENVAQVFMGMRIQCAQCHNHPFDRWTQDDYYSFAAFFIQIGRKNSEDQRERIVFNKASGEVNHPVKKKNAQPVFLGGEVANVAGKDRREVLASWLVAPENPYFARNFANRIWYHFFGLGIVDPVDDVRASNPASNEELLQLLTQKLVAADYDFKSLIREICNSHTYQRSTKRNDTNRLDEKNFAHQTVRRIKAEQMLDIISQATNHHDKFRGLPLGTRAVEMTDGAMTNYFLTTFGRASRLTPCSCEVRMEPNLSQALHMINGDAVSGKIRKGGLVRQWTQDKMTPEQAIEEICVRTLTRKPQPDEMEVLLSLYADNRPFAEATEDVFWTVLNMREFLFNH